MTLSKPGGDAVLYDMLIERGFTPGFEAHEDALVLTPGDGIQDPWGEGWGWVQGDGNGYPEIVIRAYGEDGDAALAGKLFVVDASLTDDGQRYAEDLGTYVVNGTVESHRIPITAANSSMVVGVFGA